MGKALIITEKPSVARDIASALGGFEEKQNGDYFESDHFVCTYAVGHLLELLEPEAIDESYKRWSLTTLPIIPEQFRFKEKPGQTKRLSCIKRLINRKDVDRLINACDAAREGELIFREIQWFYEVEKPVFRLWLQSMTKEAIRSGFDQLKPDQDVLGLGEAARCRAQADWLIGMNASRALSIRLRTRSQRGAWSAGRVQTPTLGLLVQRELEILNYRPVPYWRITADFGYESQVYTGTWFDPNFKRSEDRDLKEDRIFDESAVKQILADVEGQTGEAFETRKSRKQIAPPLFNLTALQKAMSNRHGWSSKRTLQAAQRCYEAHKVLTYPRTSSSCLPEDYMQEVDRLLGELAAHHSYGAFAQTLQHQGLQNTKRTFNDAGVSDHFAIIPTGQFARLEGDDARVYDMVTRRFLATFFPPAEYDKVQRTTRVAGHSFRTGPVETMVKPGWQALYVQPDKEDKAPKLPALKAGGSVPEEEAVKVKCQSSESEPLATKPPPRISEARLLTLMESAGKQIEDEELASALISAEGLGTAATRADIIENLKNKEYVDRSLRPTPKGIRLIESLHRIGVSRLTSAELTADIELHLNQVEQGGRESQAFMHEISEYIGDVVERVKEADFDEIYPNKDSLGACPVCAKRKQPIKGFEDSTPQVYERAWFYACETNTRDQSGCGFLIWKDNSGRYIDRKTASTLVEVGETEELDGFFNASGQGYKAKLKVEDGKVNRSTSSKPEKEMLTEGEFEVDERPLGPCPYCYLENPEVPMSERHKVIETPSVFICEGRRDQILADEKRPKGFILPRSVCQREITREEAVAYVESLETPFITDFVSKKGRKFKAKLKLRQDGRHEFEFPPRAPRGAAKKAEQEAEAANAGADSSASSAQSSSAEPVSASSAQAETKSKAKTSRKVAKKVAKKKARKKAVRAKKAPSGGSLTKAAAAKASRTALKPASNDDSTPF